MIRDWRPGDLPALLDLWQESWQATMPAIDFAARRPGFAVYLQELVENGASLRVAADQDGQALGFYTLDGTGYLDQIAVGKSHWGQGTAAALIADAKARAPGRIDLKVNQANLRAIAFYERQGFLRMGAAVNPVSGLPLWLYGWRL